MTAAQLASRLRQLYWECNEHTAALEKVLRRFDELQWDLTRMANEIEDEIEAAPAAQPAVTP